MYKSKFFMFSFKSHIKHKNDQFVNYPPYQFKQPNEMTPPSSGVGGEGAGTVQGKVASQLKCPLT